MPTKVELRKTLEQQGIKDANADIAEAAKALKFGDKMNYTGEEGKAIAQKLTTGQTQPQRPQPITPDPATPDWSDYVDPHLFQ